MQKGQVVIMSKALRHRELKIRSKFETLELLGSLGKCTMPVQTIYGSSQLSYPYVKSASDAIRYIP
jgi:hypothetical protein